MAQAISKFITFFGREIYCFNLKNVALAVISLGLCNVERMMNRKGRGRDLF
jgi:hypothetical protein